MKIRDRIKYSYVFIMIVCLPGLGYTQTNIQPMDYYSQSFEVTQRLNQIIPGYFEFGLQKKKIGPIMAESSKFFLSNRMPLFCRIEFNVQGQSNIPLKIRLGDIDYVDRLEGKRNFD